MNKHYIYSVHAISSSRWSKGYTEYYITDVVKPSRDNPIMSSIVLQIGETEEIFKKESEAYQPSTDIVVRLNRVLYNDKGTGYSIKDQKGYLFSIDKQYITTVLMLCLNDIDQLLENRISLDVNDTKFLNWTYQVSKG